MAALQRTAVVAQAALRRPTVGRSGVRFLSQEERARRDAIRDKMQRPDDTPVYLRGGPADKALFGMTCVLTGIGVLHTIYRVYCRM